MSRPGGEGTTGAPVSPTFSRSVRKRRCDQAQAAERLCTCFFCGQPSEESARRCRGRARSPAAVSSWGHAGLPCTARAGGVRVQIGPRRCPVLPQTLGQGHGLPSSRDRLHSISGPRLRRHFLLEAILLLSCVSHPPPTQPSWHHQDSPASAPRLRPATCICGRGRGWLRATSPHCAPPQLYPQAVQIQSRAPPPSTGGPAALSPSGGWQGGGTGFLLQLEKEGLALGVEGQRTASGPAGPGAGLRGEAEAREGGCWQALAKVKSSSAAESECLPREQCPPRLERLRARPHGHSPPCAPRLCRVPRS